LPCGCGGSGAGLPAGRQELVAAKTTRAKIARRRRAESIQTPYRGATPRCLNESNLAGLSYRRASPVDDGKKAGARPTGSSLRCSASSSRPMMAARGINQQIGCRFGAQLLPSAEFDQCALLAVLRLGRRANVASIVFEFQRSTNREVWYASVQVALPKMERSGLVRSRLAPGSAAGAAGPGTSVSPRRECAFALE
jgi:hypothetical protein